MHLLSFGADGWGGQLASGLWLTLRLAFATLPLGLVLGLLLALAILAKSRALSWVATLFATAFRALPELLTLFIIYYGSQFLLQWLMQLSGADVTVSINGFLAGMIALGIVFAAFASEIFVAAIRAIPQGQLEAAAALGLSPTTAFRYVVVPQVMRLALPGLGNLWFVLLKDTALVSIIALNDLMRQTQLAVANTKEPLFFYAVTCLIYLMISIASAGVVAGIEARLNRAYRGGR